MAILRAFIVFIAITVGNLSAAADHEDPSSPTKSLFQKCVVDGTLQRMDIFHANESCKQLHMYGDTVNIDLLDTRAIKNGWYRVSDALGMFANLSAIDISNVQSENVIRGLVNELPRYFRRMVISPLQLERLEKETFKHYGISELTIIAWDTTEIAENAFFMPLLEKFYFIHSRLRDTKFVATLPAYLKILNLSNNQIAGLPAQTFMNQQYLQVLRLGWNHIRTIERDAFFNLHRLEQLHLRANEISVIESGVFVGLESLSELNLEDNPLKVIDPGTLYLPGLHQLALGFHQNMNVHAVILKKDAIASFANRCYLYWRLKFGTAPVTAMSCETNKNFDIRCSTYQCSEYKNAEEPCQ